ncbi:MAG TPA: hypothetical protein VK402_09140 [Blastococcus sp.]|nr:hypothetical protein [Blastococcus sp.]
MILVVGHSQAMWLFFTRRLRMWLILTVVLPLTTGVARRLGRRLEARRGPSGLSRVLLKAGDLGDRARSTLRGGRRRG